MVKGLFVTGTDTGVGKTHVACGIVRALVRRGMDVGVMKPVETGVAGGVGADTAALMEAAGSDDPPERVCPCALPLAASPLAAARAAGVEIALATIERAFRALAGRHACVVAEGAGGWAVPVAPGLDMGDIAGALGLPVLVVARRGLGTVNHTRLTVDAVRSAGLEVAAVVLNGPADPHDASAAGNAALIAELTAAFVFDELPWGLPGDAAGDSAFEALAAKLL
jgi:dethiobiotin synthetase